MSSSQFLIVNQSHPARGERAPVKTLSWHIMRLMKRLMLATIEYGKEMEEGVKKSLIFFYTRVAIFISIQSSNNDNESINAPMTGDV